VGKGTDRIPVTGTVLAGGRSLRMGIDKTLLPMDGEPLVSRVAAAVDSVCAHTIVVTNRPEALEGITLPAGVRIAQDEVAYQGPLGGLATALGVAGAEWVLAVAADMPWLSADVVRKLWDARDGAQVVIPVSSKGSEPLLALYHRDCLPVAREVLASGRRRLLAILPSVKVVEVLVEELRDVDPQLKSLVNVTIPYSSMIACASALVTHSVNASAPSVLVASVTGSTPYWLNSALSPSTRISSCSVSRRLR